MKKISLGIILFLLFIGFNVQAEEVYYTNNNGLNFTEFQYQKMTEILDTNAVANLTQEEYDLYEVSKMAEDTVIMASSDDQAGSSTYGTLHETASKRLTITAVENTNYYSITVTNTWLKNPAVRSYDMIGVRLANTYFYNDNITSVLRIDTTNYNRSGMMGASNGVGCAMLLKSGTVRYIILKVYVKKQGTVFASYQHSIKGISLNTALNFSISSGGYGGVFKYPSSIGTVFDQMAGVYITLSS